MTAEASTRPWRAKQSPIGSNIWIVSGETFVASASSAANAALIVDAVNSIEHARGIAKTTLGEFTKLAAERNRLRDLVKRLSRVAQDTLDFAEALAGIIPDNPDRANARSEIVALLREARAATMEDGK